MNEFLHRPVSAYPLAFFRIIWGIFLLYYYLSSGFLTYTLASWPSFIRRANQCPADNAVESFLLDGCFAGVFRGVYAVALASAIGMLLGWRTRLTAVLTFACAISLITPVPWGTNGADQLVKILSFLFME